MKTFLRWSFTLPMLLVALTGFIGPAEAAAPDRQCDPPTMTLVASGFSVLFGNTIGPDGAIYVAEPEFGTILRFDPQTNQVTTYATGLPILWPDGIGVIDVEFSGNTAYALVTLVDPFVGGHDIDGIYRMDGPNLFTPIADIGLWAKQHPPQTEYEIPTGLQFAFQPFRDGFLVTDGHHNRVYSVSLRGHIAELIAFDDIVPTGIQARGKDIYMAELGPVPCLPQDGKIVAFRSNSTEVREIASGAPMVIDVKFDCRGRSYALSQGVFPENGLPGDPALPDTGSIVKTNRDGTFTTVIGELNQPTSFAIVQDTAYVFTLNGEVWKVTNIVCPTCE